MGNLKSVAVPGQRASMKLLAYLNVVLISVAMMVAIAVPMQTGESLHHAPYQATLSRKVATVRLGIVPNVLFINAVLLLLMGSLPKKRHNLVRARIQRVWERQLSPCCAFLRLLDWLDF